VLSGNSYVKGGFELSRVVYQCQSRSGTTCLDPLYDPTQGPLDTGGNQWRPFRSVDGTVIPFQADTNFNPAVGGNFWLNTLYNVITTNEIAGARTGPNGTGAELMQVLTGVQSSGLGCGQRSQPVPGGGTKVPKCWLVVVPRGDAFVENANLAGFTDPLIAHQAGVYSSPVSKAPWANRIAIPLEFNPVESPCNLGNDERRISGSELALPAVASWQPSLCAGNSRPPFSFAPIAESAARRQLVSDAPGSPGLIAVSQPLDTNDPSDPIVYAPLTLSGMAIGFNVERLPQSNPPAPADVQQLAGIRVADIRLTPRLVAKLLTQSYADAVKVGGSAPAPAASYTWVTANPRNLAEDPDFLQFNPEFTQLAVQNSRTMASLQLPVGNSDAAQQVWDWVLADPEAKSFLDGTADQFGMKVNPVYSTNASANPTGIPFGDPEPNSFPKADSYCFQAQPVNFGSVIPPQLCGTDWVPYTRNFAEAASNTRAASDGAKIDGNNDALAPADAWKRTTPQQPGNRSILSVTDTASVAQFGLQAASLTRAGDDGANRTFIAPTDTSLTAGAAAMVAKTEPQVLEPDPTVNAPGAYPLTTLTYAAVRPLALSTVERADFAAFVDYASTSGQVPGLELGQLPRGFVPLPADLKAKATAAVAQITTITAPPTTPEATVSTVRQRPSGGSSGGSFTETPPASEDTQVPAAPSTTTAAPTTTIVTAPTEPATTTTDAITLGATPSSSRLAVPGLGLMALGSALGALEITKRPRRQRATDPEPTNPTEEL
jgi:hypothetical protein